MPDWSRKRACQQAYLAGIIDGEGSFGIYDINGYAGRLTVAMHTPEAVVMFKALYPDGKFTKRGPEYRVVYNQFNAYEITEAFIPYLIGKQQQAKVLLSFLAHRRREHQQKAANGKGHCDRCEALLQTISRLKREVKGVNSVNALLDHGLREYRAKREDVEQHVQAMLVLLEGVETSGEGSIPNKPTSAPEQEIVH